MKAIIAIDRIGGISKNDNIPFNSKSDLNRFKKLTLNSNVIMGRKTFDSIIKRNGKPLEKRLNYVITRNKELLQNKHNYGANVRFITIEEASSIVESDTWIIGGKEIYTYFEPFIKEWHISKFYKDFDCDINYDIYNRLKTKFTLDSFQTTTSYEYEVYKRV